MKGLNRKIDVLGRVTLPIEFRRHLNMNIGDKIEVLEDNGKIIIQKCDKSCVLCGNVDNLTEYNQKYICNKCLDNLKK